MKKLKFIAVAALMALSLSAMAQSQAVMRKGKRDDAKTDKSSNVTQRMQSFYDTKTGDDADLEWMRMIYRELDLTKAENAALYYPEEPNEDGQNLFYIMLHLVANSEVPAYEYLDGKELFTDKYRIKPGEMLTRFEVLHTEGRGSTERSPRYDIDDSDVPSKEVLSYYVVERYEFDRRESKITRRVQALCPVLHRTDYYGGEPLKYPMFWVKMDDLRPYLSQQYVFTSDDNNLARYSVDDFFVRNMYKGDIYKTKNLRNLSMAQMFPDPDDRKHAQDSIEARLASYDKNLWVPSREELKAMREGKVEADSTVVVKSRDKVSTDDSEAVTDDKPKRSTKRGRKDSSTSKSSSVKVKKAKAPKTTSSNAARSVRRRK